MYAADRSRPHKNPHAASLTAPPQPPITLRWARRPPGADPTRSVRPSSHTPRQYRQPDRPDGRAKCPCYLASLPPVRIVRLDVILLRYRHFSRRCEDDNGAIFAAMTAAPACALLRPCPSASACGIRPSCSLPVLFPPGRLSLRSSLRRTAARCYPRPENRIEATPRAACRGSAGSPAGRLPLSHSVANPWTRDHAASAASCESGSDSAAANGAAPR